MVGDQQLGCHRAPLLPPNQTLQLLALPLLPCLEGHHQSHLRLVVAAGGRP